MRLNKDVKFNVITYQDPTPFLYQIRKAIFQDVLDKWFYIKFDDFRYFKRVELYVIKELYLSKTYMFNDCSEHKILYNFESKQDNSVAISNIKDHRDYIYQKYYISTLFHYVPTFSHFDSLSFKFFRVVDYADKVFVFMPENDQYDYLKKSVDFTSNNCDIEVEYYSNNKIGKIITFHNNKVEFNFDLEMFLKNN